MVQVGGGVVGADAVDVNFAVLGGEETTAQIERVVSMGGQFLRGVRGGG